MAGERRGPLRRRRRGEQHLRIQSLLVELDGNDGSAWFLGDVVQSVIQVEHPEWAARYDAWPDQVVSTRRSVLELLAGGGALAIVPHLAAPVGRVERTPDGCGWVPAGR